MIYLIHGKNSYESWKEVSLIKDEFLQKNTNGEVEIVGDQFSGSFSNIGFFNKPILWIVKRLFQMPTSTQLAIWSEINNLKNLDVIMWEDKQADKRTKIYKEALRKYDVREFDLLKGAALTKWIVEELSSRKIVVNDKLVQLLAFRYGANQDIVVAEISKLKLLLDSEGRFEVLDRDFEILSPMENFDIWELVEAFFSKNKKKAINLVDRLRLEDKEEIAILAGIGSNLKSVFLVLKYGFSADAYAKDLGIHPFVFSKSKGYAKNFSLSRIERLYEQILNLDFAFKRSEIEPKLALELLIASL